MRAQFGVPNVSSHRFGTPPLRTIARSHTSTISSLCLRALSSQSRQNPSILAHTSIGQPMYLCLELSHEREEKSRLACLGRRCLLLASHAARHLHLHYLCLRRWARDLTPEAYVAAYLYGPNQLGPFSATPTSRTNAAAASLASRRLSGWHDFSPAPCGLCSRSSSVAQHLCQRDEK